MKIPSVLRIGGHTIKVFLREIEDDSTVAEYKIHEGTITIDKRLPQSQQEVALIHEIFHVLNSQFDEDKHYEWHVILESLSQQFYQVLKDNKLLK